MAGSANDLFLFGEDFEAILDILEGHQDLKMQFESSVSGVSTNSETLYLFFVWRTVKSVSKPRALIIVKLKVKCCHNDKEQKQLMLAYVQTSL